MKMSESISVSKMCLLILVISVHFLLFFSNFYVVRQPKYESAPTIDLLIVQARPISFQNNTIDPAKIKNRIKKSVTRSTPKIVPNAFSSEKALTENSSAITNQVTSEPAINLDLTAMREAFIASEKKRKISPLEKLQLSQPKDLSIEANVERITKKAQREDCRYAYASTGLIAIFAITADAITGKGCKW